MACSVVHVRAPMPPREAFDVAVKVPGSTRTPRDDTMTLDNVSTTMAAFAGERITSSDAAAT